MKRLAGIAFLLLLVFCVPVSAKGLLTLNIFTVDGRTLPFHVEMARTDEELERGLMNRPTLPVDQGMIFDFGTERPVSMWMKNTLIPLDMLFIAGNGRILSIAERTVPESLETIPSPGPVRFVLELNGGTASRLGIHAGDRIGAVVSDVPAGARP